MDLSITIPTFNGIDLLLPCLESIAPAAGALRIETLVVDNGSTDGTADEVSRRFPGVRLLHNEANCGFSVAVNRGLESSSGRHLLVLNNDARLTPGSLEAVVGFLDRTPGAGIATPQLVQEDGTLQNSIANLPTLLETFAGKSLLRLLFPRRFPGKRTEFREPVAVESVVGAALFVRRDLLSIIGGLDERFFAFLEETDWCLRARKAGWSIWLLPGARVVHLQGRTANRSHVRKRIEYTRSLFLYFRKNHPRRHPWLRLFFPMKTFFETLFSLPAALLTLGLHGRSRRRLVEKGTLLGWLLLGGPDGFGLRPRSWRPPPGRETLRPRQP